MRFRVSQELRQPVGTEFSLELRQRTLFLDDEVALSDVQGRACLLRTDRGLLVSVHARALIGGTCSRCLSSLQSPIEIDLEEEFIPVVDPVSGVHITAAEAEDSFVIDAGLMLNLGEALRQYALISSPSKPLCRPECAGICPTCGTNLNERRCTCPPQIDMRWQALAAPNAKDQEGS
ncbi:hypothetical protein LCGC14_2123990 [marine sediment metagenome]|uniref:DUF177 domain-containing protein n=1 Tax=marine sediment metagenome TaxID=412755 RepID=A0A0F9GZM0_9ZZZZ